MDKKSCRVLTLTVSCLLFLSTTAQQVIAWPCNPPACPSCYTCTPTGCECLADCGCGGKTCSGCYTCSGCSCVLNCSSIDCETCNEGVCEDQCPALGKHCYYGSCVECRDVLDCESCYECGVTHECEHPCDECYYPKYCGYACACVECYPGPDDTTTCSGTDYDECVGCSMNPLYPCAEAGNQRVYTHNTLTTCTGPNCETRQDVLCYTTYDECEPGPWIPLIWCVGNDVGPPSCQIEDLLNPIGCWNCSIDPLDGGVPSFRTRGFCPTEAWP
jgi:hypothetical protein